MSPSLTPMTAARLVRVYNLTALIGINLVLLTALFDQLVMGELPCPLCLLQRVAFIMVGIGFLLNVRYGAAPLHYGLIVVSALAGVLSSGRQVLLHIVPGSGAYGSALFGLHLYTWSLIAFVLIVLSVALALIGEARVGEARAATAGGWLGRWAGWLLAGIVLINVAASFLECGLGPCEDSPTRYQLLGGLSTDQTLACNHSALHLVIPA